MAAGRPAPSRGQPLRRNTPALWNLAWSKQFFWDGRAPSLEAQVRMPIEAADEMGGDWPAILRRLEADAALVAEFRPPFPTTSLPISEATVVKALASYVRSLVSPPTRFDAWIEGDAGALTRRRACAAFGLFTGKAGCMLCHVGWRFTDDRFHDIGLPGKDPGRAAIPDGTPGPHGLQDAEPARGRSHGALHARRFAADAGGRAQALHRRLHRRDPRWRPT